MCQNLFDVGWARHGVDQPPMAVAPKGNQSRRNHISNLQSSRILCDFGHRHAVLNPLIVHAETNLVYFLDKKRQT